MRQKKILLLWQQKIFFDPIRVWNGDLEDSGYLWIYLEETKLSEGGLGVGEAIENSNLLATFENGGNQMSSLMFWV